MLRNVLELVVEGTMWNRLTMVDMEETCGGSVYL